MRVGRFCSYAGPDDHNAQQCAYKEEYKKDVYKHGAAFG